MNWHQKTNSTKTKSHQENGRLKRRKLDTQGPEIPRVKQAVCTEEMGGGQKVNKNITKANREGRKRHREDGHTIARRHMGTRGGVRAGGAF